VGGVVKGSDIKWGQVVFFIAISICIVGIIFVKFVFSNILVAFGLNGNLNFFLLKLFKII